MVSHDVALRSPAFLGSADHPPILQRTDQDFLRNVLAALNTEQGRASLAESLAKEEGGKPKLYRPMHRTFHLALVDARCITLGSPRLDGRKVESAGVVIRRVVDGVLQGWMQGEDGFRGWVPLRDSETLVDPDPTRRQRPSSGNEIVDAHLVRRAGEVRGYREAHSRLFVAPPSACEAAGATVLYGLLPLGSAESTSAPVDAQFTDAEAREMLPGLLRAGKAQVLPSPGGTLRVSDVGRQDTAFKQYASALEQLLVQLDLRGEDARAAKLRSLLSAIEVTYPGDETGTALAQLERGIDVLVNRDDPGNTGVRMPVAWPVLTQKQESDFAELVRQTLDARLATFAPRIGRFDREGIDYELWAFVRVRSDDGCAPRLYWSRPSKRFTLASWFESGPVPPPLIPLPEITRDNVKKLKPNVAFALPPSLFNFLRDNLPDKLMQGEAREGSPTPAIQWICGFNLSIIFMVAFVVMFIFVILLNIVFFWLPFIKICIPIPASFKSKT